MRTDRSELSSSEGSLPDDYDVLVEEIRGRIRAAQHRAAVAVNSEMLVLYWHIGHDILVRQRQQGWGAKVIDRLSADLRRSFPNLRGVSARNLKYMRALAEAFPDQQFVQEVLAQITWYHAITLLDKVSDPDERAWYIAKTIEHGWSRAILVHQIETRLHLRQGNAVTNFARTLPPAQSDLAHQLLKDPYTFDFLTLADDARERDLEQGLLVHIRQFLIELGVGFAFVAQQFPLNVGGDEFAIDLLFYHLRLHCYVVIDLKMGPFKPEFAGKMNFYLSAVDDLVRDQTIDQPTIGLILCRDKNRMVAEYALRGLSQPLGVADFETRLTHSLPSHLRSSLPTIEEIERQLEDEKHLEP